MGTQSDLDRVVELYGRSVINVLIQDDYGLRDADQAVAAMESRSVGGKLLIRREGVLAVHSWRSPL
jgi:D-arabinose 1-dehydrogenase-like Zn-dependent alcohol dehydrogenase